MEIPVLSQISDDFIIDVTHIISNVNRILIIITEVRSKVQADRRSDFRNLKWILIFINQNTISIIGITYRIIVIESIELFWFNDIWLGDAVARRLFIRIIFQ